jgi:hypothetical protein
MVMGMGGLFFPLPKGIQHASVTENVSREFNIPPKIRPIPDCDISRLLPRLPVVIHNTSPTFNNPPHLPLPAAPT